MTKRWSFRWLAKATISACLAVVIIWAGTRLDWGRIWQQLQAASLPLELAMAVAWTGALLVRPLRMMVLMGAMAPEVRRRYWPVWSADMIAMAVNSVVPMRAGDMMMAFVLNQGLGIRTPRAMSVVLVDRFFDFATVMVMFMVMLAAAPTVVPWAHDVTITLAVTLALLIAGLWLVIHMHELWKRMLDRVFALFPGERSEKWRQRVHELLDGLGMIDRPGILVAVVGTSILMWGAITASYWFGVQAVWPHMTIPPAAFAASAVALSFIVPLAPGGLGVFHGAAVLALSLFGVPPEPALAFAIVAHAWQMGSVLILGTVSLFWQGISLRSLTTIRGVQS